jgi:hypothetical protein
MRSWPRVSSLLPKVPGLVVVLGGLWVLVRSAVAAMGGYDRLWVFGRMEQSRYTAMAILTGTLKLRNGLAHVGHDEQVFNGAGYTNWGFGVPLLQVPFHAVAAHMAKYPSKFFPDRAIFFAYLLLLIPFLWAAFDRILASGQSSGVGRLRRLVVSCAATLLVLTVTLYPLMSCRFLIYEETISYLTIFELLALSAYVLALPSWRAGAVCLAGAAAGIGLLVRPTGLVYVGFWGMLILLESRKTKPVAMFAAAVAPFLVFWMYSNWVRSGILWSYGHENSLPWFPYHTPILRFGNQCANTRAHAFEAAQRLFRGFFLTLNDDPPPLPPLASSHVPAPPPPPESWLKRCHFEWEHRGPDTQSYALEPFFGLAVLVLLVWTLLHHVVRRERRLSIYLPYATLVVFFVAFVFGVPGAAWRYAYDFWPLIVVTCVQYARSLPPPTMRKMSWPLAAVFAVSSFACYRRNVEPALATLEITDAREPGTSPTAMWEDFSNSRYSSDPPLPSQFKCGDHLSWPFHNGQGWSSGGSDCRVDTFTNVFLGVPAKSDDHYELRFTTKGMTEPTLRVYVNGRIYVAHRSGDVYSVPLEIRTQAFASPIVMTTIEWTSAFDPRPGELLSIELV